MMQIDPFAGYAENPYPVFDNIEEIEPSDTNELPVVATMIVSECVAEDGQDTTHTIHVTTAGGQEIEFTTRGGPLPWPVRVRKVWATGTTATRIIAFW